jgi:hypothetical protein
MQIPKCLANKWLSANAVSRWMVLNVDEIHHLYKPGHTIPCTGNFTE